MIKSGYSELESKEQAYNKAIKNRVVGMFTSKNYRH
jgi:hypothetical protein